MFQPILHRWVHAQQRASDAIRRIRGTMVDGSIERHVLNGSEMFQCGRRKGTTGGEKGASHVARHFASSDYDEYHRRRNMTRVYEPS